ncbi:NnrU family protein [Curvibacter sp. APW13]|uniref:NnrU family protein n=1 Tax=Curvibacter sp. APW13 TaxID=3077236 RepID=UPI0028DF8688|nr:NnrU family protein [Curvibacter sp. APW13]MDT8990347.1 NnrU family protein [Curvibacter sp. APW13]
MTYLVVGLVLFLGLHSVRIVADDWRSRVLQSRGEGAYKGLYSLLSLAGFALIVFGFGVARETPVVLWTPPLALRHIGSLLVLVAFVLLVAAYVPRNAIKARVGHPMVLGVKTWALAHLLMTGRLETVVLFGAFLAWGVLDFVSLRRRDRAAGVQYPASNAGATVLALGVGVAAYAVFAVLLHGLLIGIKPF